MNHALNDRAQAGGIGIARVFFSLGVGAIVFWILNLVTDPLFARADTVNTAGSAGAQGTSYLREAVAFAPILFAFVTFFGLIAYSVFSREVLG